MVKKFMGSDDVISFRDVLKQTSRFIFDAPGPFHGESVFLFYLHFSTKTF